MVDQNTRPGGPRRLRTWAALVIVTVALAGPTSALAFPAAPSPSVPHPPGGAVLFSSLAPRGWDVYLAEVGGKQARRLTDHPALDYNAAFRPDGRRIAFVSERDGNLELYAVNRDGTGLERLTDEIALDDHPAWSPDGKRLAFCSTRQPAERPGRAWNAIYVMSAEGRGARRISPKGASDYSPAWSPKGDLIACASGTGAAGGTDLFVMRPDGGGRKRVVKDGGWPAFSADGQSLFFHSRRKGRWGVWRVSLDGTGLKRVTPGDIEAFTPRASADGKWLVMAVRRGSHRQIERLELATGKRIAVTDAATDHWGPSLSADGRHVLYHRAAPDVTAPNVEVWGGPPGSKLRLLRLAGSFPAVAPGGQRVALVGPNFSSLDVMNIDGSGRKTIFSARARSLFSLSWSQGGGRIAFSHGTAFQGPKSAVNVETIAPDGTGRKALTEEAGNNGFPSFAPDGKRLVFRSGRGGHKNLYIMKSDGTGVRRLTEGKWTDTMADWSPDGKWIVFASDRGKNFEIWLIRPDGTGLKKLVGGGGRNNHPHFSPDGRWVVFTSQRAGLSAEEVSLPRQPQPYGELFAIRTDGAGLVRLTHNGFEEGTPAWAAATGVRPAKAGKQIPGRDD